MYKSFLSSILSYIVSAKIYLFNVKTCFSSIQKLEEKNDYHIIFLKRYTKVLKLNHANSKFLSLKKYLLPHNEKKIYHFVLDESNNIIDINLPCVFSCKKIEVGNEKYKIFFYESPVPYFLLNANPNHRNILSILKKNINRKLQIFTEPGYQITEVWEILDESNISFSDVWEEKTTGFQESFPDDVPPPDTAILKEEIPIQKLNEIITEILSKNCPITNVNDFCIPFKFADGCWVKAHYIRTILEAKGFSCKKIFTGTVEDESINICLTGSVISSEHRGANCGEAGENGSCMHWDYHVAVLVDTVAEDGKKAKKIIDLLLFDTYVEKDIWINKQKISSCNLQGSSNFTYIIEPSDSYAPTVFFNTLTPLKGDFIFSKNGNAQFESHLKEVIKNYRNAIGHT